MARIPDPSLMGLDPKIEPERPEGSVRKGPSPTAAVREDKGEVMLAATREALLEIETPFRRKVAPTVKPSLLRGPLGVALAVGLLGGGAWIARKQIMDLGDFDRPRPADSAAARAPTFAPPPPGSKEARIDTLLARARAAYVAGKVSGPGDDSFRAFLLQVDAIDPKDIGAAALRNYAVAALRARGGEASAKGDLDGAIAADRELLLVDPRDSDGPKHLAGLCARRAAAQKPPLDRVARLALLDEAIPLAGADPDLHVAIADGLLAAKDPVRAAREYQRALELAPDHTVAEKGLARAKSRAGLR